MEDSEGERKIKDALFLGLQWMKIDYGDSVAFSLAYTSKRNSIRAFRDAKLSENKRRKFQLENPAEERHPR